MSLPTFSGEVSQNSFFPSSLIAGSQSGTEVKTCTSNRIGLLQSSYSIKNILFALGLKMYGWDEKMQMSKVAGADVAVVAGTDVTEMSDDVRPQLFWDGERRASILMRQAFKDVQFCCSLDVMTHIFDIPASGLMARIKRYADGRQLTFPQEINEEASPFYAIKYAYCENWEEFNRGKKRACDLTHLRAYFWDHTTENEELMCITHFIIKNKEKLDTKDTYISRNEKAYFLSTNCQYSTNNWECDD